MTAQQEQIKEISLEEWNKEGERRFGKDKKNWKFVCPNCSNIQSAWDFIKLEIKNSENYIYFSCIGRFIEGCKGKITNKISPCDYTNGGLFDLSKLKVIDAEGNKHSVFEFAEKEVEK